MTKIFPLPKALTIRIKIFGLLFLMGLLAALFAGCGDGTEQGDLPDSGTVARTDSGAVSKLDVQSGQPVTCKLPADVESVSGPLPANFPYLATSDVVICTNSPSFSQPPYNKVTCSQLAANDEADRAAFGIGFSGCCVMVHRAGSSGPVSVSGVACNDFSQPAAILCSLSGVFLGWACAVVSP